MLNWERFANYLAMLAETAKHEQWFGCFGEHRRGAPYFKKASLGGDDQDVRVTFILHRQQFILWRAAGTELERRAGSPDLTFVGHITELVELAIVIGHIIT